MLPILSIEVCDNAATVETILIIKNILNLIHYTIPAILVVISMMQIIKTVTNDDVDNGKLISSLSKKMIAAAAIFLLPTIINFVMSIAEGVELTEDDCWSKASNDYVTQLNESEQSAAKDREKEIMDAIQKKFSSDIDKAKKKEVKKQNIASTGKGMGKVLDVQIKYRVKDSKGRCGKGANDYCASYAKVKYENGTVKYYVGYQNNSGMQEAQCRVHALTSVVNAIKDSKISSLDMQKYLHTIGNKDGVLKAYNLQQTIDHYGLTATIYHNELSDKKAAKLLREAIGNGQPVMVFVSHSACPDLAGTHHAHVVVNIDKNDHVQMIDSVPYNDTAKKRTPEELAKCLSHTNNYYRMIIFSFD